MSASDPDLRAAFDYVAEAYPTWTRDSIEALVEEEHPWPDLRPGETAVIETFFANVARRMYDECDTYVCVEGCCSVLWHPDRGNVGGAGPVGCPCQELEDPRDPSQTLPENRR